MGLGYLKIQTRTGEDAVPVIGADVLIKDTTGKLLYRLKTNENGTTDTVKLYAPEKYHTLDPYDPGPYYSVYEVDVFYPQKYINKIVYNVQIFDTITAILPVDMLPLPDKTPSMTDIIDIPPTTIDLSIYNKGGNTDKTPNMNMPDDRNTHMKNYTAFTNEPILYRYPDNEQNTMQTLSSNEILIPDYITVHLGAPTSSARNVRVSFTDYIKNVASSEIYPTWPNASLRSNIYAQISFALNRVFTQWYRSRGFNFDITSSTSVDQSYVDGRDIFENISIIIDEIFNSFIRRPGRLEPLFAQFCNGTTSTCPGLSQWGTVTLANQGMTPLQILRHYYPNDVIISTSNNIAAITSSYPGSPLREGSTGEDVRLIQRYLNRIRVNYPLINQIANPNGVFADDTKKAVTTFQQIFNLTADGIVRKFYMV